ncbi:Neuronal acetylcholine receptor subunit alpha-9 [Clonorchis sinensis]|uniref:Neuronal acetylcholine receptor subunit alpha-9 n=1 Tax=Clonorchis sinensis TaxID=79923 RepID=A0A419QD84_CLOSI|nr:Neuronal acetylcholine receptor subunit alpha-9 [Clonorchis sinensis]
MSPKKGETGRGLSKNFQQPYDLLSFWLPPDSGEKITLGITVLLAFSVFMLLIAENMPATSEFVPLIGIYLTVTMAMTSLSIVLTVGVLHIHHTNANHSSVPERVRVLLFDYVAPLLRMSTVRRYRLAQTRKHLSVPNVRDSSPPAGPERGQSWMNRHQKSADQHVVVLQSQDENSVLSTCHSTKDLRPHVKPESKLFSQVHKYASSSSSSSRAFPTAHSSQVGNLGKDKSSHNNTNNSKELSTPSLVRDRINLTNTLSADRHSVAEFRPNQIYSAGSNEIDKDDRKHLSSALVRIEQLRQSIQRKPSSLTVPKHHDPIASLVLELTDLIFYAKKEHARLTNCVGRLDRQQREERDAIDASNEWQMVASIVDRLLFWLFLFVAIFATLIILVIMPLFKPE